MQAKYAEEKISFSNRLQQLLNLAVAGRVCPPPATTLAGRRGGWGVNILEDERNRIALLQ